MSHCAETLTNPRVWLRDVAFTTALSLLAALLGPFGSYDTPLTQRVAENLVFGFASFIFLWPPARVLLYFGDRARIPEVATIAAGMIALTTVVTTLCLTLVSLLGIGPASGPWGAAYLIILSMTLPAGLAYLMIERRLTRPAQAADSGGADVGAASPLAARLPAHLGGEIHALRAEDHYVRVYTALGSALLLMRLSDAISELGGLGGERVHRSWWVARAAVKSVRREGRKLVLVLPGGVEAPVTREAAPKLRKAGWV